MNPLFNLGRKGLLALPLLFLIVFFLYPLGAILQISLIPEGELRLDAFVQIARSAYYRDVLLFTTGQALLSTVLTLVLALPGAFLFTRYQFPGKSLLLALATLPFVLPTVVVATAFSALVGARGVLNNLLVEWLNLAEPPIQLERTLALILIAHVFYNYSVALRILSSYWANQSLRQEEAARALGCHGWRLWWEIRLPLLRPALLAAALLVFMFTFTSFGVVLLLGGVRFSTLEVQIYYQSLNLFNLDVAGVLSLLQIFFMFAAMLVYARLQRRIAVDLKATAQIVREPRSLLERGFVAANVCFILMMIGAPLFALLLRSLQAAGEWSLRNYMLLAVNDRNSVFFVPPLQAVANSVFFALLTTITALVLGLLAAYLIEAQHKHRLIRFWLDPIFMLPLATSAVTLGFGFIIALDKPPLNLRASWLIVPVAHTLVALPFVIRSVLPALRALPPQMREAAAVLGAGSWARWRLVDLPLISRALLVGATFAFTVSMGEFGASLFVARPELPTIPVAIFRLLGQPGASNYGQALALSVILLLVCALCFVLIERARSLQMREF